MTTIEYEDLDYMARIAVLLAINGHDVRVTDNDGQEVCYVIEYERYTALNQTNLPGSQNG